MKLFIVLLATCARVSLQTSVEESSKDVVRYFLPQLCQGINACNGNQTSGNDRTLEHCCTDCSCDPSCELSRNCCFPKESSPTSDTSVSDSECLYPMTMQVLGSFRRLYQSYWMVNDVKNNNKIKTYSNQTALKCGDVKVAPWGSLMPVFSKEKQKIYKNTACAEEDNVRDGILWDFQIISKQYDSSALTRDASSYISNLYLATIPRYCRLHFRYPGDISDLKSERCFMDLINTCKNKEFTVPKRMNLTSSQIREACTSGLVSPYRARNMYANVFCYMCNGYQYSEKETCFIDVDGIRGFTGSLITILLNGRFVAENIRRIKEAKIVKRLPLACPKQCKVDKEQDSCRQIHCSSGHERDRNSNCVFVVKKLFMKRCVVHLKLTADSDFDIEGTLIFNSKFFSLSHQWPRIWTITSVSYEVLSTNMRRNLYINMVNMLPKTNTAWLLRNIQKFIKLPWTLTLRNGTKISMFAELGFAIKNLFNDNSASDFNTEVAVGRLKHKVPQFNYLYNIQNHRSDMSMIIVTKLYFCEQIELNSSEYEILENDVLLNKITNQVLFNGEYSIIMAANVDGEEPVEKARICLEDSGLVKIDTNEDMNAASTFESIEYAVLMFLFPAIKCMLFA